MSDSEFPRVGPGLARSPIAILHLEDSDLDASFIRDLLERAEISIALTRVTDRRGFVAAVESQRFDVILSDYQVPGFDGLDALDLTRKHQPDTPFIFVSGAMGEELAIEMLHRGATDYVLKERITRLPAAVQRAVDDAMERERRRKAEAELDRIAAESDRRRRLYETILSNTPDLVYVFDLNHRFTYANDILLRMWGKTWDEAIGRTCLELGYEPWHAEMHDREIEQVKATKQPVRGEVPFTGTFGRRIYDYIFVPVLGPNGEVEAVAGTTRDVTERKQTEEERERLLEQLREVNQRKDEFLATLAHELRNPLAPIRTGLGILRRSPSLDGEAKVVDMMDRQVTHLVRLVDDLLDVSRVTSGKITLRQEPLDLRQVVEVAVETSRPVIEQGRHRLTVTLPTGPLPLDGDRTRLAQVFTNILGNAAKYTPPGGQIELSAAMAGAEWVIRVTDTGVGIPHEMLPRVFEVFTQVGRTIDRSQGGLGLGLALVKRLVEMHGGSVRAESPGLGRGSSFFVRLPVGTSPIPGRATATPVAGNRAAGPSRRVLVVDDNVDAAQTLAILLGFAGHEPEVAFSGPEGLARIRSFRPEVVVLDIGLPGMNGYEVARAIRAESLEPKPLLIALTGWGSVEDQKRAQEAGFDFHLTKPVEADVLYGLLGGPVTPADPPR